MNIPRLEARAPRKENFWKPKMYGFRRLSRKLKKRTAEARLHQIATADRWEHLWRGA